MKKLILIIGLLLVSGCGSLDFDMLTCKFGQTYTTYEIQYKGNAIKGFTIIKEINVSNLDDQNFEMYLEDAKKVAKTHNKEDGIIEHVESDQKIVTISIEVDYDDYDVIEDSLHLFSIQFEKKDFDNIQTLRDKLVRNQYVCDEIVEANS